MSRKQFWIAAPSDTFPAGEAYYHENFREDVYWGRWRNAMMEMNNVEDAREMLERARKHNSNAYIVRYKTTITRTIVE